jgi:putative FmdB family regulatory protein
MPMYEYRCPDCDTRFEKLRRMSEAEEACDCPACSSKKATRQLSGFAAVTAGGGGDMQPMCAKPGCGPTGCGGGWKN